MSKDFYERLPSFSKFDQLTDESFFENLPEDWCVIISDVQGSTKAIESGRYQDVNTVGAATIACAQNAMNDEDFPFVFGGDGATLLVHSSKKDSVLTQLLSLKRLSEAQFGLPLRVGAVPVSDVYKENGEIKIAKYEITQGQSVAIFKGGGVSIAEDKIKDLSLNYQLSSQENSETDLSGLSCRWKPVPNKNGSILSILVVARNKPFNQTYKIVIEKLSSLFDGGIEGANPIQQENMSYQSLKECVKKETKYYNSIFSLSLFFRLIEVIYCIFVFRYGWPAFFFDAKSYASSIQTHSDHKKFDDMLRMVVDCSPEQENEIRNYLQSLYQSEQVFFGIHSSNEALMTCLVQSPSDGNHIHFVDGSDGGYAMAAKELKQQMSTAVNEKKQAS